MTETAESTTELLALRDLRVAYRTADGPLPAVRGVDLVIHEGEVVGVAGESGCGKSTLVSTVLRLQPKSARVEGEVEVLGHDVRTMRWGDLRALRLALTGAERGPELWTVLRALSRDESLRRASAASG